MENLKKIERIQTKPSNEIIVHQMNATPNVIMGA
jgi:hypothetical protein